MSRERALVAALAELIQLAYKQFGGKGKTGVVILRPRREKRGRH